MCLGMKPMKRWTLLMNIQIGISTIMATVKQKAQRAMGHITILTKEIDETLEEIKETKIWS